MKSIREIIPFIKWENYDRKNDEHENWWNDVSVGTPFIDECIDEGIRLNLIDYLAYINLDKGEKNENHQN